jgi:hypothetical protein
MPKGGPVNGAGVVLVVAVDAWVDTFTLSLPALLGRLLACPPVHRKSLGMVN